MAQSPPMHRVSLFAGTIAALPLSGRPTGMFKQPLAAEVAIGLEGLAGDEQADRRVHGGPDKAVHLYPSAHYARLTAAFPETTAAFIPGSLGENISCATLDEASVRVGATFTLGSALLQVCQPRSPCWKIDDRFGCDGIAAFIAEHGLTGWYFRVLRPGTAAPGSGLEPVDGADAAPTLAEAAVLWQEHRPPAAALQRLAASPGIAAGWRNKITARAAWLEGSAGPVHEPAFHVKPEAR